MAFAALATMRIGLLGLGYGVLIRHTAGAISAVVGVLLVLPLLVDGLLPSGWYGALRFLPANAAWAMYGGASHDGEVLLPPVTAAAVLLSYAAVLLTIAGFLFAHRDA